MRSRRIASLSTWGAGAGRNNNGAPTGLLGLGRMDSVGLRPRLLNVAPPVLVIATGKRVCPCHTAAIAEPDTALAKPVAHVRTCGNVGRRFPTEPGAFGTPSAAAEIIDTHGQTSLPVPPGGHYMIPVALAELVAD